MVFRGAVIGGRVLAYSTRDSVVKVVAVGWWDFEFICVSKVCM